MAALLIALAIMAILLSVAMPVWRHEARREKEAELVFRGEQYARAIALYRFKNANVPNAFPASLDMLVDGRYLRKKYKDPMSSDGEFQIMPVGSQQPGIQNPPSPGRGGSPQPSSGPIGGVMGGRSGSPKSGSVVGGIMGVRSKSQETSLRSYRGQTRYDQWAFTFNLAPRPGGAIPMANTADGRSNEGRGGPGVTAPGGGRGRRGGGSGQPGRGPGAGPGGFPPPPPPPPAPGTGGRRGIGPGGRGGGL